MYVCIYTYIHMLFIYVHTRIQVRHELQSMRSRTSSAIVVEPGPMQGADYGL